MAPSPMELLEEAQGQSLAQILQSSIGGAMLALALMAISTVQSIFEVLTQPLDALGIELGNLVEALLGGPIDIIGQGAASAVASLEPGGMFYVGPLTFPLAVVTALSGGYVLAKYLELEITSDTIPFSFTDIPFIGVDEDDEGQ